MAVYDVNGNIISSDSVSVDVPRIVKSGFIRSIAHRGYSTTAPENTIPAFKLAKVNEFDAVELDVKWTSDNIPIILHDSSIARTARNTDGSTIDSSIANANVSNLPLSTLEQYDYGIWKSSTYAGTKLPTFEEAIKFCKDVQLHVYIEISNDNAARCSTLVSIVKGMGMLRNVTWASKFTDGLRNIQQADNYARIDYFVNNITSDTITTAATFLNGKSVVVIGTGLNDSDSILKSAIASGLEVECGLLSSNSQALNINSSITACMSNDINARKVIYDTNIA